MKKPFYPCNPVFPQIPHFVTSDFLKPGFIFQIHKKIKLHLIGYFSAGTRGFN